jgi:hypothetical protein
VISFLILDRGVRTDTLNYEGKTIGDLNNAFAAGGLFMTNINLELNTRLQKIVKVQSFYRGCKVRESMLRSFEVFDEQKLTLYQNWCERYKKAKIRGFIIISLKSNRFG